MAADLGEAMKDAHWLDRCCGASLKRIGGRHMPSVRADSDRSGPQAAAATMASHDLARTVSLFDAPPPMEVRMRRGHRQKRSGAENDWCSKYWRRACGLNQRPGR